MVSAKFKQRDVIAISDFSKEEINHIIDISEQMKFHPPKNLLDKYILATCFFEPSTRTRLSFESAMHRLGGKVIGFTTAANTSTAKGETLDDSMKMIEGYADVAVIRHPQAGSAQLAADAITIPVINAGDGSNQHPTQTFLDLFTIKESQGTLENLHVALVGDLKHSRTIHSLIEALIHYNCRLYFVSAPQLEVPESICDLLRRKGIKFSFHQELTKILPKLDVIYMTRIQEERFTNKHEFEELKMNYRLSAELLKGCKPSLRVLHPLPRVNEIDRSVDSTPYAYYFQQAQNGLYTRQAILSLILGVV